MSTNDGGPAFPCTKSIAAVCPDTGKVQETYIVPTGGMTLRDYFAAKVLPNIWTYSARLTDPVAAKILAAAPNVQALREVVGSPDFEVFDSAVNGAITREAYRIADAMLAARAGGAV